MSRSTDFERPWWLSLFAGAHISEIIRGGISSVPRGQEPDAAKALSLTFWPSMTWVVLPQALPVAPAAVGEHGGEMVKEVRWWCWSASVISCSPPGQGSRAHWQPDAALPGFCGHLRHVVELSPFRALVSGWSGVPAVSQAS